MSVIIVRRLGEKSIKGEKQEPHYSNPDAIERVVNYIHTEYRRQCAIHSYPCGEQTGFILLAKEMYPPVGNCRKMENGEQHRGLPGVRFLGVA